jgi:rhamnogalacturonyl hydrolase YesR
MLSESPDTVVRFATGWADDMFMATSVLARVGARTGDSRYADAAGRLLVTYIARLQRDDGLFIHALTGAHAWGRGNGFAALGMTEALMRLPESWSARAQVLEAYRRQMNALLRYQGEDGSWREVIDQPTAYQELTVTALAITTMSRGVRFGWLDATRFRPVIERAWSAVLERVADDGTLRDVCTSTGAQATLEYYMTRPIVNGADDRGGAMVLLAALEMEELRRAGSGTGIASGGR